MSDEFIVSLTLQPTFRRATHALHTVTASSGGFSHTRGPQSAGALTSFDEERREMLASVLSALAANPPDPDEMAACHLLLRRITESAVRSRCLSV